jgi:hypothetical protein
VSRRPLDRLLGRLDGVRQTRTGYIARCPSHADRDPSLSITEADDGRVLVKCFAACTAAGIVAAVGLTMADLFPGRSAGSAPAPKQRARRKNGDPGGQGDGGGTPHPETDSNARTAPPTGLTLGQYAEAKKLDPAFLWRLGVAEFYLDRTPAVRIPYSDGAGNIVAVRFRLALTGPDRFRWKNGSKACLYGLNRLADARAAGHVVLVEGESDAHTLWFHNFPAVGLPGANTWREEWAAHLDGIPVVYIVIEADTGGEAVRRWLAASSIRDRARLVQLAGVKDPSALHLVNPDGFKTAWAAAVGAAIPWVELHRAEQDREAIEAFKLARPLLEDPGILERVAEAMRAAGYAGDLTPPLLAYAAMTSRLLERPMNLVFVAPSAAGKNRAVDAAAVLIPPEAIHVEKAGSARALVYADEDYQHRVVVVNEADSIPGEGPAASAIRALAADNSMNYDVVEKDERTGRHRTRHIVKPGPTGLITTSTESLPPQFGTRHLEVSLSDDPGQTRAVMLAHAQSVTGTNGVAPDTAPFLALQQWLAVAGAKQVIVPFATTLSHLVPPTAVRMRRDFRQLLTCVQAVALLRQCQRERTGAGTVIATIEDYAEARALLVAVFDTIAAEGVTPAVRETVMAVRPDEEEVSAAELARRLNRSKGTISYRVSRAVEGGWLVNREARRGCPAKLARGVPLPETVTALPEPSLVWEAFERSSRSAGGRDPAPAPSATDDAGGTLGQVHPAEPESVKRHPAGGSGLPPIFGSVHEHLCPGCRLTLKCTVPLPCDFTKCARCKLDEMQRREG